jgi:hypothetical protein
MRISILAIVILSTISRLTAAGISVDTGSSATASYRTFAETAGPLPWSDLGFTVGSSVSAGTLNVNTGGSTSITGDGPVPGGYGTTNLGPLIPWDPSGSDVCGPVGTAYAGDCINQVTTQTTPEPDGLVLFGIGALLLLAGGLRRKFGR